MSPQGGQVLRVFDARANGLGESTEEMSVGCGKLVARNEPTVTTKPLFDALIVEDGKDDGCLAYSVGADQSDGGEALGRMNDSLNQLVAPKEESRWRRRKFPKFTRCKSKTSGMLVTEFADPFRD